MLTIVASREDSNTSSSRSNLEGTSRGHKRGEDREIDDGRVHCSSVYGKVSELFELFELFVK